MCPLPLEPPAHLPPVPPLSAVTENWLWVPFIIHWTSTGDLFYIRHVYVSVLFAHIIPPSPSLTVSKMSVSPLLPCKSDHQCCLSTLHACMPSLFSRVWLFATLWTVARQTPLFMRFSRHKYWSGLHFLLQGIFPDPGIKLASPPTPAPKADSLPLSHWGSPLDSMLLLLSRFNRVRLCATP